jgi:hypothetical protein
MSPNAEDNNGDPSMLRNKNAQFTPADASTLRDKLNTDKEKQQH